MQSMTGFGRAEGPIGKQHYTLELKSVNHRFVDLRYRSPSSLSSFEHFLAETLRNRFQRGAFDISIRPKLATTAPTLSTGTRFVVDETAAQSLAQGVEWINKTFGLNEKPNLSFLAATGRVFVALEEATDTAAMAEPLKALFDQAATELEKMREAEGAKLKKFLKEGLETLKNCASKFAAGAASQQTAIAQKVKSRIEQWQKQGTLQNVDSARLEWEIAFYADRSDITEEIQRLNAHIEAFTKLLDQKGPVGRKLDFLTQEMHREVNTISSKANLLELSQVSVEAKTSVEKLREQVQNVE